jgi:hypothetical protein
LQLVVDALNLGSDTMLEISNVYSRRPKASIYTYTGMENMQKTPHTNRENTKYII